MQIDIVDVFGSRALSGNPLAVVHGAAGMETAAMQALTNWLGFSETTFLLPVSEAGADYRVRIFCPGRELPFAGHPTLGTCHAWLAAGGAPARDGVIVQQCAAGLVELCRIEGMLAFRAPPLLKGGALNEAEREAAARLANVPPEWVVDAVHANNGPGWKLLRLRSAQEVLAVAPPGNAPEGTDIGLVGPISAGMGAPGSDAAFELRAFFSNGKGGLSEDPVTGSLNAACAQYLFGTGLAKGRYVAAQGRKVGADGRVVCVEDAGGVWVAGRTATIAGGAALNDWSAPC